MTPATQTLAAWLLEQIAADEAVARGRLALVASVPECERMAAQAVRDLLPRLPGEDASDPAHVLAVCEAHRRIVNVARYAPDGPDGWGFRRTLRALAAIYADRDGWREEWR